METRCFARGCVDTACGNYNSNREGPLFTDNWKDVTCKKCLQAKNKVKDQLIEFFQIRREEQKIFLYIFAHDGLFLADIKAEALQSMQKSIDFLERRNMIFHKNGRYTISPMGEDIIKLMIENSIKLKG